MVELIVDNEGLDLGDAKVQVSFQVNDLGKLETRQGDYSFEFELPGTQKNRRLLNRPEGINANPYDRIPCILKNGNELKRGFLQVTQFKGKILSSFYAGNTNWISELAEKNVNELDLSALDHQYTEANVTGSFANTEGYIYPYINVNGNLDADLDDIAHTDLYPAVFVSTVMKRIFLEIDHKLSGTFLNTPDYKRLILPFVKPTLANSADYYTSRSMYISLIATWTNVGPIPWDKFTSPYFTCSLYSSPSYTADADYSVLIEADVAVNAAPALITAAIWINGAPVDSGSTAVPATINLTYNGSLTSGDVVLIFVSSAGAAPTISTVSFFRVTVLQAVSDGDLIQMSNTLPNLKQLDLIKWLAVSFGLIITYDEYSKTVNFDMFRSIKQNTAENWSDKLSPEGYKLDFFEFINGYSRINYLRYDEADETGLVDYRSQNNQGFGDGIIQVNNEFITGADDMYGAEFVPTWFEEQTDGANTANISDYLLDEKPRILICVPDTDIDDFTDFSTINVGVTAVTEIPFAYFAKYKLGTGLDSITLNLSYDNPNILNVNGEGLTDKYWGSYEDVLQEPIMLKAKFKLRASDILNLDYTKPKYIEAENITGYWFLNRIVGYDFSDRLVECELVKL